MWSATPVCAALTLLLTFPVLAKGEVSCSGASDGLHVDYDSACREYARCERGLARARYSCEPGRAFSTAAGACVPRRLQPCVRRSCAPADLSAYAAPGTSCREYYRCVNGTARDFACPPGAWFDFERQGCTRGAGACYEPVCGGLPDGSHSDPSQDCRRRIHCNAGELKALVPCAEDGERCPKRDLCPSPRSAAVALPVGDTHFCSDDECSTLCQLEEDGAHADRASGCREYYECSSRQVVGRGICEPGRLFSVKTGNCEPAKTVSCPLVVRGRCFGRADGLYRDWRDCKSWFACRRERVVARGSCDEGLVWDGAACVSTSDFHCTGPEPSIECATRPSGFYQDLDSNCSRYFHCDDHRRTELSCGPGRVYDGESCVRSSDYICPSLDRDTCYKKSDGLYRAHGAGCRGHYACTAGIKSWRVCAPGLAFDEVERACVDATNVPCPADSTCLTRADGYHADETSGCRNYFYCESGERLATLTCFASRLYDGTRCVEPFRYTCGAKKPPEGCSENGFEVVAGSGCRSYVLCSGGARVVLHCARGRVFNGQVCVAENTYTCPVG